MALTKEMSTRGNDNKESCIVMIYSIETKSCEISKTDLEPLHLNIKLGQLPYYVGSR